MTDKGYVLVARSRPGADEQLLALSGAGVDVSGQNVFLDTVKQQRPRESHLKARARLLDTISPGDIVHVHSAPCLSFTATDLAEFVVAVIEKGGEVRDAYSGVRFAAPVDPVALVRFGLEVTRAAKREAMRRYRKNNPRGRGPTLSAEQEREARKLWETSDLTNTEIAKKFGVTKQTLWRKFGPRGENE